MIRLPALSGSITGHVLGVVLGHSVYTGTTEDSQPAERRATIQKVTAQRVALSCQSQGKCNVADTRDSAQTTLENAYLSVNQVL